MIKIKVIGIGNRLMMDDGLGVYIVDELKKNFLIQGVEYKTCEADLDFCLQNINATDFNIIIDAAVFQKTPGDITILQFKDLKANHLGYSVHDLHLLHFLDIEKINGIFIGIEPDKLDFHIGLSNKLNNQFNFLVKEIDMIIHQFM